MRFRTQRLLTILSLATLSFSCGQGYSPPPPPAEQISVSLSPATVVAPQDGTPGSVTATVSRTNPTASPVSLTTSALPAGVSAQISSPGSGTTGTITFTAPSAAAGTTAVTVTASDGTASGMANLSLVVAVVATVGSATNTSAGVNGRLQNFMATSFQPADWDYTFFTQNSGATATLDNLKSQHIRLQAVAGGVPQKADQTWDFSELDAVVNPVISVADKSPEFQIAVAPTWMDDSSGHLVSSHFQDFANYCANLVKYYNTAAGFTDANGKAQVHSPSTPITWWGIFNEPNINGLTASDYTTLYNLVVPAMQAAGSQVPIKFVAVELSDFGNEPQNFLPTFVSGVTAEVDAVATHYYSSCNQADPDPLLFSQISGTFVPHVSYIYSQLKTNPALAGVPVWVTENNVNADFDKGGGISACNGTPFVTDARGTSAFFAAWRPYVFSQLGQAGAQALYHWDFDADTQYGEVDFNTGKTYLSYWVDYYLERFFPSPPGQTILELNTTDSTTVETLAVRNADGSVVVMVADRAVHAATDNNGTGDPRTVVVDVSALGAFSSASQLTIDATTDPVKGPASASVTPAVRLPLTLGGYGVTFLTLKP
ncbi:MAG TPA: hypothetical protein VJV74_06995 [Terriglobia bacterium]|nr:hypothetical protein [Terriglobia bacterium]